MLEQIAVLLRTRFRNKICIIYLIRGEASL